LSFARFKFKTKNSLGKIKTDGLTENPMSGAGDKKGRLSFGPLRPRRRAPIGLTPSLGLPGFTGGPQNPEMPTQRANGFHLAGKIVGRIRQVRPTQVIAQSAIDAAGDGAHVIHEVRQFQPATFDDASIADIPFKPVITGISAAREAWAHQRLQLMHLRLHP
jgi:hypothetical protein